jgi:hypothetical protein
MCVYVERTSLIVSQNLQVESVPSAKLLTIQKMTLWMTESAKVERLPEEALVLVCHTTMTYSKDFETSSDGDNTARR